MDNGTDGSPEEYDRRLRCYQKQLVDICRDANSIIYLPTGSGKTFIAIHTLKIMSSSLLSKSLDDGGKRSVFLVPTKALVHQTAEVLKVETSFEIGEYTGDKGIDFWPAKRWKAELEKNQVFVMPPAVMQNLLKSGFVNLNIFNLIVADECHHGVDDNPFRAVMREMQNVPESERPRIIGMTAALINRNISPTYDAVNSEIKELERTFHSQIATCDDLSIVLKHSTNPKLTLIPYNRSKHPSCGLFESFTRDCVADLKSLVGTVKETEGRAAKIMAPHGYIPLAKKHTFDRVISRAIDDFNVHLDELGIYGAAVAALYHTISLEMDRLVADSLLKEWVCSQAASTFQHCRSTLLRIMEDDESAESILKFSSEKVQELVNRLRSFASQQNENELSVIIFVQRRVTAIVLNFILKKICKTVGYGLEPFTCAFVIGGETNPFQMTREQTLEKNYFRSVMKKFKRNDLNMLIATNVIEEGVDIQACNLVIKFDTGDLDYRSYLQAQGRARSKTSLFLLFAAHEHYSKTLKKISQFNKIKDLLCEILVGRNDERTAPSSKEIEEHVYDEGLKPYYVAGPGSAHVTGITAIPCVFNYCARLPQDLFSKLEPLTYTRNIGGQFKVAIQLPTVCPIFGFIEGDLMPNSRLAKRSAFLKAVKLLHAEKELSDDLKPVEVDAGSIEYHYLFPHYVAESGTGEAAPGTKSCRRFYPIKYPAMMNGGGLPTPGKSCYLHVLRFTANLESSRSERILKMGEQYTSSPTYAILTTNSCPKICTFPLYTSACEISCELLTDAEKTILTETQIDLIANFHLELFTSVIPVAKDFQLLNRKIEQNSYYVVPVFLRLGSVYEIDWDTIVNVQSYTIKVEEDPTRTEVDDSTHYLSVISPFYRCDSPRLQYLVTKVCYDLSPLSSFPDDAAKDFVTYYKAKYNKKISNLKQPLLEVKPMPKLRNNFIRMRQANPNSGINSRRRRLGDDSDFNETLVPELCDRYLYPSSLWLKAFLLPTALFRVTSLLLADELLRQISVDTKIGGTRKGPWAPLIPDLSSLEAETTAENNNSLGPSSQREAKVSNVVKQPPASTLQLKEPELPYCHMDKIAECDLQYFVEYARKPFKLNPDKDGGVEKSSHGIPYKGPVTQLKVLNVTNIVDGPQLRDILAAVTAKAANDIVNLERLETLGDSFLKFASALFLFREFPKMNEGALVTIKNKLVSNRNLLYCGQAKNITDLMQPHEFSAEGEWNPPLLEVHHEIRDSIMSLKKDPRILYNIYLSQSEKRSGVVSMDNLCKMRHIVLKGEMAEDEVLHQSATTYLFQKCISDKSVADCVEALLGAYLQASGTVGGFKMLNWFNILPTPSGSEAVLIGSRAPSPLLRSSSRQEVFRQLEKVNYKKVEQLLGYSFNDKAYLLQALTHATFLFHKSTNCYQRLELLGDAVLDFLITSYIFQEVPHLDPGKITALRSALVNNNTFASLAVRYGLHRFLLYASPALAEAITTFVSFQADRNHIVDDAVTILLSEEDCHIAESVEVPKVLGDVFESLAGAIFLDSGNSLRAVWDVYYRLMKTELDTFPLSIPRNSIQILHEIAPPKSFTIETKFWHGVIQARVELTLPSGDVKVVHGTGPNKFEAKRSAAKVAIKILNGE